MARGRLEPPNLDDRTWQTLVDQAKALVPHYAPEWTDLGPSDPGITLIELFAWLVEGMTYRLNRVPDKNYIAFLNLLGITRSPSTPASTWLTYKSSQTVPVTVPAGTKAATKQTESQPAIVFETDAELDVLPGSLVGLFSGGDSNGIGAKHDLTAVLVASHVAGQGIPGKTWLWADDGASLYLWVGFDGVKLGLSQDYQLHVEVGEPTLHGETRITAQYWKNGNLTALSLKDFTFGLHTSGMVTFAPPDEWAPTALDGVPGKDPGKLYWAFLTVSGLHKNDRLEIKHLLFNSVSATAVQTVNGEFVGLGTGKAFQSRELANRPIYKDVQLPRNPYGHVKVMIAAAATIAEATWILVDSFDPALPNQNVFRLDPVSGTIEFGDGLTGRHPDSGGNAPAAGARITATYRWVPAGEGSNVPAGAINTQRTVIAGITAVNNPAQAFGGEDEQDIEETKRLAPQALKNFDRAVTAPDYEVLARKVSAVVKKVRCLGPSTSQQGNGGFFRVPGSVAVIIIPDVARASDPRNLDTHPSPSPELIREVQTDLDAKRPLTAALTVTGPRYRAVTITGKVYIWPSALQIAGQGLAVVENALKDKIDKAIVQYLHPIKGNSDGNGWEVGKNFFVSGLFQVLEQTIGDLGYIANLTASGTALYTPAPLSTQPPNTLLGPNIGVGVADYEIICSYRPVDPKLPSPWHSVDVQLQPSGENRVNQK